MILRIVLLLALAFAGVGAYLVVFPHDDRAAKADAVIVLSGTRQRLPVGERLVREGYAPLLVVSRSTNPKPLEQRLCRSGALCFRAEPYSTRGEARAIARLAAQHHWRTIDVVTSKFHVFRARILIRRCYHGGLRVVGAPQSRLHLPIDAVKETLKLTFQEVFARGC